MIIRFAHFEHILISCRYKKLVECGERLLDEYVVENVLVPLQQAIAIQ